MSDWFTVKAIAVEEVDSNVYRGRKEPRDLRLWKDMTETQLYEQSRRQFYPEPPYKIEAEFVGEKAILINGSNCARLLWNLSSGGGRLVFYYTLDVDR